MDDIYKNKKDLLKKLEILAKKSKNTPSINEVIRKRQELIIENDLIKK